MSTVFEIFNLTVWAVLLLVLIVKFLRSIRLVPTQSAYIVERLGKYKTGKSCLYINKLADVDLDVLEEIIASDWATMQRIYPAS